MALILDRDDGTSSDSVDVLGEVGDSIKELNTGSGLNGLVTDQLIVLRVGVVREHVLTDSQVLLMAF